MLSGSSCSHDYFSQQSILLTITSLHKSSSMTEPWACRRPRNNESRCVGGLLIYYNFYAYQKRTETSIHKRIYKKKSSWCRDESVNALGDKAHKQGMPHSDLTCTPYNMATLFNNHPYISSSGTPVGTKFTAATYVGIWLLNNVAVLWNAYHITVWHCALSASAFIEPDILHQLDFLWRLVDITVCSFLNTGTQWLIITLCIQALCILDYIDVCVIVTWLSCDIILHELVVEAGQFSGNFFLNCQHHHIFHLTRQLSLLAEGRWPMATHNTHNNNNNNNSNKHDHHNVHTLHNNVEL